MSNASNVRWRIFSLLALSSFVSYVLRGNMSIASSYVIADLGLSEIQWGWVLAAFTAGYGIFQFPGGVIGDKFGPRKALTGIAILWGVMMVLTVLVPGPKTVPVTLTVALLIVVRFLVGAVHAPIFPVINTAIVRWFPVGSWALPLGLSSTALTLGFAAASPVLTWLTVLFGWRVSFLLVTPLAFVAAGLWWWYARDRPGEHRAVNDAERALIGDDVIAADDAVKIPWYEVLKNRNVLLLMLSYSCMNFVFYEVFNWLPYYLDTVRELDASTTGIVTALQWIAGGAGAAAGGWVCDRLCAKLGLRWGCRWPIIVGMLASGVFLVVGAFHGDIMVVVTVLGLCFFFNQLTEGSYWATSIAIGKQLAGTVGGVMNTGANIVGTVNAVLIPWLAFKFGWQFALASGAGFASAGVILLLFVKADQPVELAQD